MMTLSPSCGRSARASEIMPLISACGRLASLQPYKPPAIHEQLRRNRIAIQSARVALARFRIRTGGLDTCGRLSVALDRMIDQAIRES